VGLDVPAHLEAVDVRQVNVEDDQVGLLLDQAQRLAAGGGLLDLEARLAKDRGDGVAVGLVVVHVEDGPLWLLGHAVLLRGRFNGASLLAPPTVADHWSFGPGQSESWTG
jgi:hypothetical protein